LHFGESNGDVGQELCVGVLFEGLKCLQGFFLELNGLLQVLLAVVHARNLDVAIADLLALGAERHLIEFPGLTQHVQGRLVVFLSQVHLTDNLQDLPV